MAGITIQVNVDTSQLPQGIRQVDNLSAAFAGIQSQLTALERATTSASARLVSGLAGIEQATRATASATQTLAQDMTRSAQQMERAQDRIREGFTGISAGIRNVAALLTTLAAMVGLTDVVRSAIDAAASFQQLDAQLRFVVGSLENFRQAKKFITDFAVTTPLQIEDVQAAFVRLYQSGLDAERIIRAVAEASAFQQFPREAFQGILKAITDIASRGKLTAEELNRQLANWGISAIRVREEMTKLGVTITDDVGSAGVGAAVAIQALLTVLEADSQNALKAIQSNWVVVVTNLRESWRLFADAVVRGPLFEFITGLALIIHQDLGTAIQTNAAVFEAWGRTVVDWVTAALRGMAQFVDFLILVGTAIGKVLSLVDQAMKRILDFEASVGRAIIGTVERLGQSLGLISQTSISGTYITSLQEGKITLEDVNKAIASQQDLLKQGSVTLGQSTPQADAYFEAYRKGQPKVEATTQSLQEWFAALIGADPHAATTTLEGFLTRQQAVILKNQAEREQAIAANEKAALERRQRAIAAFESTRTMHEKDGAAKAGAAREQALVAFAQAERKLEKAKLDELQALRLQALEADHAAALESSVRTQVDLEAVERAFVIRRLDLTRQSALEDIAIQEEAILTVRDARLAAIAAQEAAAQAEQSGSKQLAKLAVERKEVMVAAQASMQEAANQRMMAEITYEKALTDLVSGEAKKRLALVSSAPAQALAGTMKQLEAQTALIEAQVKGEVITRAEGARQIEINNESLFALTQARLDRESAVKIAQAQGDEDAIKLIHLQAAQELGELQQKQAKQVQDIYNTSQREFGQLVKANQATISGFIVESLNIVMDHTRTFKDFFQSILLTLRHSFIKFLADLAAIALAKPLTVLITGAVGASGASFAEQIASAIGLGSEGAAGATGGGLLGALGLSQIIGPAIGFLSQQFQALGGLLLTGAQSISRWVNSLIYPGIQDIGTSITTVSQALQLFGGFAGVGANLFKAFTAETTAGRVGGGLGAGAAGVSIAATLGLLPAALGPIGLALAAIVPLLSDVIGGKFSPAGPRFALGGLGGLGIGGGPGGLRVTGTLTSRVGRAERIPSGVDTDAIQNALTTGVTNIVNGMVEALNQVALKPEALIGTTQEALNTALKNALTVNSSSAKNFQKDLEAQVRFVGVQVGSFFLRPLTEAFRQLETAELDAQLARLPDTTAGMVDVFQGMNEQLNQLSSVANTDVLRQLSSVRNRVEDFGNSLADSARVVAESIVTEITDALTTQARGLFDQPLAQQITTFSGLMDQSVRALAALRTTRERIGSVGLDTSGISQQIEILSTTMIDTAGQVATNITTGALSQLADDLSQVTAQAVSVQATTVNSLFTDSLAALNALWKAWHDLEGAGLDASQIQAQFQRLMGSVLETTKTVLNQAFTQGEFSEFLAVLANIPAAVTDLNPAFKRLQDLGAVFGQVVGPNLQRIQALEAELRSPEATAALTATRMTDLHQAIAEAGTSAERALPLYAQLSEAIEANAQAQIDAIQAIGTVIERTQAILASREGPAAQLASMMQRIQDLEARAIRPGVGARTAEAASFVTPTSTLTIDDLSELTDLYGQQLELLEQMRATLEATLSSIEDTLLAQQSITARISTTFQRLNETMARIQATGPLAQASPDELADLVTLNQQLLSEVQSLIGVVEGGLESIADTMFSLLSLTEQAASLQAQVRTELQRLAVTGTATPEQLIKLVDLAQRALRTQQEITRALESTLASAQQTLAQEASPASRIASIREEIARITGAAVAAGGATPEQLQRLVELNQELLAVGKASDLLAVQVEALNNLKALAPYIQAQIDASKALETQLVDLLSQIDTVLRQYLTAAQTLEAQILTDLTVIQQILQARLSEITFFEQVTIQYLNAQLVQLQAMLQAQYGTTNIQAIIRQIQEQALAELRQVNANLQQLFAQQPESQGILTLNQHAATQVWLQQQALQKQDAGIYYQDLTTRKLQEVISTLNQPLRFVQAQHGGIIRLAAGGLAAQASSNRAGTRPLPFASGGMVPAMLEAGERVMEPPMSSRQVMALTSVNQAFPRFGGGGWTVPGSGEGDRVPAWLKAGSFVVNNRASHVLGSQGGGTIHGGAQTGSTRANPHEPQVVNVHFDLRGAHFKSPADAKEIMRIFDEQMRRRGSSRL